MTPHDFINQLFDLSFTASMNVHWLSEDLAKAIWWNNVLNLLIGLVAFLSAITMVSVFTPRSKAGKILAFVSVPATVISILTAVWIWTYRPTDNIERLSTLRQRWSDLRGNVDDLYLTLKTRQENAKSAEETKAVPVEFMTTLRLIEDRQKKLNADQGELKPGPIRWKEIYAEESERRWGEGIKSPADREKKERELKEQHKPPLELRVL
jgi:hypothetical protein